MKAKRYFILLTIISGVLYGPLRGEQRQLEQDYRPALIGASHPTLAGIEQLSVVIVPPDAEPNKESLIWMWTELNTQVINRLNKDGIKTIPRVAGNILNITELRIDIDMLRLADSKQFVFCVQTSVSRVVCLMEQRRFSFKADVWDTEPVMQLVSEENMPAAVTSVVLEQVEAFVHAYLAANPKGFQPLDVNEVSAVAKKQIRPAHKPLVAEHKYVASKNSKVFHKPDCSAAKRIKPENLITYRSRAEAVNAGKRPCKICNP